MTEFAYYVYGGAPYGWSETIKRGAFKKTLAEGADVNFLLNHEGMTLARRLKAQNVPVLFTSIYPPDGEMLELAPSAYLVKPFPLYALERALEAALSDRVDAGKLAVL